MQSANLDDFNHFDAPWKKAQNSIFVDRTSAAYEAQIYGSAAA